MIWLMLLGCWSAQPPSKAPPPEMQCEVSNGLDCFVRIEGSTLTMGAQSADPSAPAYDPLASADEGPPSQVEVGTFWIQRHEVHAGTWTLCEEQGSCHLEDVLSKGPLATVGTEARREHPVAGITWEGARRYCAWAGGRLPTEAEWELAAKGTEGNRWPWGDAPGCGLGTVNKDAAWSHDVDSDLRCNNRSTRPSRDLRGASAYGVVGMAGNVAEWVEDPYRPYGSSDSSALRVQRGGGWTETDPSRLRTTARSALPPDQKLPDVGVRCAMDG